MSTASAAARSFLPCLALVALSSCDANELAVYNFELRTDRSRYALGDLVYVELRSETVRVALYSLCNVPALARDLGGSWERVRRTNPYPPCADRDFDFRSGAVVRDTLRLADWDAERGERYRVETSVLTLQIARPGFEVE